MLDDGDPLRRELHAQEKSELVVQLDGDQVAGARGQRSGDGALAGADLDHGVAGDVAQRSGDPLDGLRIVEEVLSELGFGEHGLS